MSEKPKVGALSRDPVLLKAAVYEIAQLVARPGEERRSAENRVRTRIRDASKRTKRLHLVVDPMGKAVPRAEFCAWADDAFGPAVRDLPGFVRNFVLKAELAKFETTFFPPTVFVANLESLDWLREHYPRLVSEKQALELKVRQLQSQVSSIEAENEALRSKLRLRREDAAKHGKKGGRGKAL